MKRTADHLTLADASILVDEPILYTLNGFDGEYNPIVVKLNDQEGLTLVDAQSALLAFESRFEQLNHLLSLSIQPTANFATKFADFERFHNRSFAHG